MEQTKIFLYGHSGRMGQAIQEAAKNDHYVSLITQSTPQNEETIVQAINACDAVIDFTHHSLTDVLAAHCATYLKPMVIGTTGHDNDSIAALRSYANTIPMVHSSNFSAGVQILKYIATMTKELLQHHKIEIVETHHALKKDTPSGTAKTLAASLQDPGQSEIPILSHREGEVVGEHSIIFSGTEDSVILTHQANDRMIYARGALQAAKWVLTQPPGYYDMPDVLGINSKK
jgi:4-hydroxy-tetrahydrodipicolinate reductase